jgi:hypothetical protein
MIPFKSLAAALVFSAAAPAAFAGSASAGTWVLDAAACPDLREDWHDSRVVTGRFDRREDFRDRRVIDCPPRAWSYETSRWDYRHHPAFYDSVRYGTPGTVYRARNGGFYVMDRFGNRHWIDVRIEYPHRYRHGHARPYGWRY